MIEAFDSHNSVLETSKVIRDGQSDSQGVRKSAN